MLEKWTGTSLAGFMLQLTPCHIVMPLTENPFCATEKILLAELVLLCKMCRVWNSRSSCCGSWQCGWHTVWKSHIHTHMWGSVPHPGISALWHRVFLSSHTHCIGSMELQNETSPAQHHTDPPALREAGSLQTVPAAICRKQCECFHEFSRRSYAQGVAVGKTSVSYTQSLKSN